MKYKILSPWLLLVLFLIFSVLAFGVHFVLETRGVGISYRLHFLFFFLHFISLSSIIGISCFKQDLIASIYLSFLLVKMGAVVFLVYHFPVIKQHLVLYFGFYWYYLLLETAMVVALIKIQDKSHVKK